MLTWGKVKTGISVPRLELGTFRVLGERHDQLDHTDKYKQYGCI